jgi:saccharopine dehydrogenase-like NADP-dependent oxidoreductase
MQRGFEYAFVAVADPRTRFSAMELTTSWGITIVAHHVASGRGAPKGLATPERFVDTEWTIAELEKRLNTIRQQAGAQAPTARARP